MINKALFKQSCKANWVKWLSVTIATCTMLAIVIIVLGNLGINDIRDSLKDVFTQADQEAVLKENSVDSYDLYLTAVDGSHQVVLGIGEMFDSYDKAKEEYETATGSPATGEALSAIQTQIAQGMVSQFESMLEGTGFTSEQLQGLIVGQLAAYDSDPAEEGKLVGLIKMFLPNMLPKQIASLAKEQALANGATEEEATATETQVLALATVAVNDYISQSGSPTFVYSTALFEANGANYVNQMMYDQVYNLQISQGVEEDDANINATAVKVISNTAISTYQLWQHEYLTDGTLTDDEKALAKTEATKSISDQIPEKVAVALEELGNMDVYGLIIGSIFYRIAGLLLPMVFVIMTANGLLAGQVDSGSMAYVLSTPTKRRTVSVTQMTYLLFSLFSMFALLTVVSVIAVWVVGGNNFAINFSEILLFNLGAFLTMFAIAGFCFMCSAIFNRTKHSLSIGGGLTIFSLVCTILGLFGSSVVPSAMRITQMNFFNYLSLITFFDTTDILTGSIDWLWKFAILLAVGIVTIIIGVFRFDKKDLPL